LGLNKFNLILMDKGLDEKEAIEMKEKANRKRLAIMFLFFIFICFSSTLASQYRNSPSMAIVFLANVYLYVKFSYNITVYGANKRIFERRMKNVGMNLLLALLFGYIYSRNNKFIKNNILYNI